MRTFTPASSLSLILVLIVVIGGGTKSEGFEILSILKGTFLSVYTLKQQSLQSKIIDHFFNGLDEVKLCVYERTITIPTVPETNNDYNSSPRILSLFYYFFPRYNRFQVPKEPMHTHAGCLIGVIRSSFAGYLILSDYIPGKLLSSVVSSQASVWENVQNVIGSGSKRVPKKLMKHPIQYAGKKLLGWHSKTKKRGISSYLERLW